jgi:hypothetical protein
MGFQFDEAGDVIRVREPSMETLDYVKRGLDDVVNTYRDSTTRRLNLDAEGQSVDGIRRQLRDELVRLNPVYGEALSAGGDPLRLEEAFRQSDRLFQVGTPERTFRVATERMGEAERNALVAGFADRLFRDAQAGRLSTRQLNQLNVLIALCSVLVLRSSWRVPVAAWHQELTLSRRKLWRQWLNKTEARALQLTLLATWLKAVVTLWVRLP